jgi:hypothetical protein
MSHWAEIDKNNVVLRVLVGDNNESDEGKSFMESLGGTWVKTSYNAKIRGKYAGIGDIYDSANDIFVAPKPFPSWIQNGSYWKAPVDMPTDDNLYDWDEKTLSWKAVTL